MLYIEQKSVEDLCYLVNEKGYFSEEADRIQGEIEYSKRQYEKMIQQQLKKELSIQQSVL